jgi:hypothetical protein
MRQGRIAGEVDRKDFAQERLLAMALPTQTNATGEAVRMA